MGFVAVDLTEVLSLTIPAFLKAAEFPKLALKHGVLLNLPI